MYKILQLSDLHINSENSLVRGIDARIRLTGLIDSISWYDLVVVTGDLVAEEEDYESYQWIRSQLNKLQCPKFYLPGNHDKCSIMADVFELSELPVLENNVNHFIYENVVCCFVDTSKGILTPEQCEYIKAIAENSMPAIIFTHYPFCYCGCYHMDSKYSLKNIEEASGYLKKIKNLQAVFSGHYHTAGQVDFLHFKQFLCPAVSFQIDSNANRYKLDSVTYGFREIFLDNGTIVSNNILLKEEADFE